MTELLLRAGQFIWGPGTILLVVGTGVWFTVGTRFLQLRRLPRIIGVTLGSLFKPPKTKGGITPFQAMSTALAGTMGTGNIAGIATAIVAGGPGAIFWMWVSAFFGMMTKYAEVVLAVKYRRREPGVGYGGGPMAYIEDGLGRPLLSAFFSVCCVLASFGIGNATQVHSAAAALRGSFGIPAAVTGVVAAVLTGLVIMGGIKRIGRVAESAIPLVSLFYLAGGALVLWMNRGEIPAAFALIFRSAFSPVAAVGGVGGYGVMTALRTGVARGIFSNEAGLGSAPIAHASADTDSPARQGCFGIFEVFADTLLVCTFTALIILTSGNLWMSGADGAALTAAAFSGCLGRAGEWIVSLSLACFALATLFCWGYYGERGIASLTGNRRGAILLYRVVFVVVALLSPMLELGLVWSVADLLNGLMAIPNIFAILTLSGEVFVIANREW